MSTQGEAPESLFSSTTVIPATVSSISNPSTSISTSTSTNKTLRIGQIIRLRPEHITEYVAIHRAVWPAVLSRITRCNIHDYSIFHDPGTGLLFASFKYTGDDWDGDMQKMAEDEEIQRWWKVTDGMQESLNDGAKSSVEGGWWRACEEVFYTP